MTIRAETTIGFENAMVTADPVFQRSIDLQIVMNQARTPTERLAALCDLLDAARAMAPMDAAAIERRRRAWEARETEREQLRARFRKLLAVQRANASTGI